MTSRWTADVDVLIVGAGPTGLVAAIDARRHGLSVRIVDQGAQRNPHSKALVLHSRSLEVLDDLGCVEPVLQAGREFRALNIVADGRPLGRVEFRRLEWSDAPYPMWLSIPQSETERCLEERLNALGVNVERQTALRALRETERGVEADLVRPDGAIEASRSAWLVGCDGARSDVRRALGVALEGDTSGEVFMLADVAMESPLADGEGYNVLAREGVLFIVPMPVPGRVRLIAHLPDARQDDPPDIDLPMLQQLVNTRTGLRTTLSSLGWTSVFSPKHFIAKSLRVGRAFLAGDAAHIHSPVGGQGLNTGIQDGYNLMWKLALVHRGLAAPALLDTYQEERHPVGERMIRGVRRATWAMTLQVRPLQAVRRIVAGALLRFAGVRNRMGAQIGMLQLRYPASLATAPEPLSAGSPRPGERAAQQASTPALSARLRGTHHTLLLLDGLHEPLTEREAQAAAVLSRSFAADAVEVVRVRREAPSDATNLHDPDGAIRRAFGAHRPVAVWVRPDKYVGFRGDPRSTETLRSYLRGVFSNAAPLSQEATGSQGSREIIV
jgi:2-polyprenyl-6-methoxyphenol hydroxylase-like FAD-dependent oxidoreductase